MARANIARAAVVTLALCLLPFAPVAGAAPAFSDIAGHWSAELVGLAREAGYVDGYPDGSFRPNAPVTRAEALKLVVAGFGLESLSAGAPALPGVEGHWIAEDGWIQAAVAAGIVTETGDDFRPDEPASRERIAVWIVRALGGEQAAREWRGELPFLDAGEVRFQGHVGLATRRFVIEGFPDGTFRPGDTATRAQTVAMIERARHLPPFGGEDEPGLGPEWTGALPAQRVFRRGDALTIDVSVHLSAKEPNPDGRYKIEAGVSGTAWITVVRADEEEALLRAVYSFFHWGTEALSGETGVTEARYDQRTGAFEVLRRGFDAAAGFNEEAFWAMVLAPGVPDLSGLDGPGAVLAVDAALPRAPEPVITRVTMEHAGYSLAEAATVTLALEGEGLERPYAHSLRLDAERPWAVAGWLVWDDPERGIHVWQWSPSTLEPPISD